MNWDTLETSTGRKISSRAISREYARWYNRLLEIVQPDKLYLGQKDFQQCMVIKKMASINYPSLQIVICPTQREPDGLAMSSRNMRLTSAERKQAVKISATLKYINNNIKPGYLGDLKQSASTIFN